MALLKLFGFHGENRALHPTLLPDTVGTSSLNQKPGYGDLRPWKAPANVGVTVASGTKTLYRMNRTVPSDSNYWLRWSTVVHAVVGPNSGDSDERTYYTGSGTPKWTDLTKAIAGASYPNSYRELGVPAPVSACIATQVPQTVAGERTNETVLYVYTYVTDAGEESAPSPVSTSLVIQNGDHVAISSLATAPSGAYGINRIRVYRTKTGTTSTEFFFMAEVASTLTTVSDIGQTLGEVLPTATWLVPPANLSHLTAMWNGMMAGISGKSVRVCEAYVPYAWPVAYEILPSDTTPVALATFGQNLVIATNGRPILVTGGSPDALDEQPIEYNQACVSAESMVSLGVGVAWASPDGLAYVGGGGARLLTDGMMTRVEWQALKPETITGAMYEGRYFGTYTVAGVTKMFMLDPANPNGIYFIDFGVDAIHVDLLQDAMYVLSGTDIQKWDAGSALTVTFKSKLYVMSRPVQGFGAAQVRADAYPVTFKLYAGGMDPAEVAAMVANDSRITAVGTTGISYSQTVANNNPFRLPGGYMARDVQIELSGASPMQSSFMAHSIRELAQI